MTTPNAHRIVVGVDPSPSGTAALEWAMREAVSTGAALHAVRAWTPTAYAMEAYAYGAPDVELIESDQAQLAADEQLKLVTERVAGADTIDCTMTSVLGAPSLVLVEQATHSAMVVVGSRGAGALSRAVLGSVSSSVVHHTRTPVVVVPEPRDSDGAAPRVIVGVDHSPAALSALAAAAEQARRRGVVLMPVFVHEPMEVPRGGAHAPDLALLEDSERHLLLEAAKAAGGADVQVEVLVGQPTAQLLAAARPQDLLVVGSRGRGGFTGLLLGSTSTQLVQHAPCPVLVVRA
jgi:nucleotide-binding universal stress UspA family protein